jgi:hypothetical protein
LGQQRGFDPPNPGRFGPRSPQNGPNDPPKPGRFGQYPSFDPPNPGRFGPDLVTMPKKAGTFWALIRQSRDVLGSDPPKLRRFGPRSAKAGTFWASIRRIRDVLGSAIREGCGFYQAKSTGYATKKSGGGSTEKIYREFSIENNL